jgi:SulP family sulfate permease
MASMAAILIAVAWNMSEAHHVAHLIRTAPRADVAVFFVCYGLTIAVDMQVAVAAGILLAAAMFMRRMSELTNTTLLSDHKAHPHLAGKEGVVVFDVNGPLFFGAAHKALRIITTVDPDIRKVVLDLTDVPVIDTSGMVSIRSLATALEQRGINLYLYGAPEYIQIKLKRFGLGEGGKNVVISNDLSIIE